jgi:hypothetical protein
MNIGIQFPTQVDGSTSTTKVGVAILQAALAPLNPALSEKARSENHWRRRYPLYFRALVEDALKHPNAASAALESAKAGLDCAWQQMQFEHTAGFSSLAALANMQYAADIQKPLQTLAFSGRGDSAPVAWAVPYKGQLLQGDSLRQQIDLWRNKGVIEPGAAQALHACATNPDWFDLSDRQLVLMGAGSEAGPLRWLAKWRAQLIAIDINRKPVWEKIAGIVFEGNATMRVPLRYDAPNNLNPNSYDWTDYAGADLLTHTPALIQWLQRCDGALDIAAHAYLDGEKHVRVALAMDLIQEALCRDRASTSLAFMATPTDVFAVPKDAAQDTINTFKNRSMLTRSSQKPLRLAGGDRFFQANIEHLIQSPLVGGGMTEYGVVDSLVLEQGPNYALAKRFQQWRALVARAAGHKVSLNIAPSTTTTSVIKNPALAAGFAGADSFGIEVFEPETTNALMAALWVRDLRDPSAAANPQTMLNHPFELFMDNACHGGLWRSAYIPRTALPFAAALGWVRQKLS